MKTGLLSVMLSLKNVWPTAKDDVLCELLLVYGETMVTPENEHNVADMLYYMSIARCVLDLVLWSQTCSVEGDLQLATGS